jgi:hypothetical protein
MSFQHRSRIKSVADYSDNISHKGACCYPHASEASFEYYNTCIANKGIWQPILSGDDVTSFSCPDIAATGCCCACSFVDDFRGETGFFNTYNPQSNNCYNHEVEDENYPCYQGGLQDNITWCECNDKGGVWSEGIPCSTWGATGEGSNGGPEYIITGAQSLCTQAGAIEDVRWPGACCAGITCNEACNANDCNNFANEYNAPTVTLYTNKYCQLPYGTAYPGAGEDYDNLIVSCDSTSGGYNFDGGGDEDILERDLRTGIYVSKGYADISQEAKSRKASKNIRSSCNYISTKDDGNKELKCSNETKTSCDEKFGIWSGFDEYSQSISCGDVSALDINDYLSNKKKISSSVVSLWKDGQRVLNLGRYVGTFNVMDGKHGEGVMCLGNENTGASDIYKPKSMKTTKNSDKKFAIIVADRDFKYRSNNTVGWTYETDISKNDVADSSRCDSEYNLSYNRHLSLSKKIDISYNNQSNFLWRIASKDEFAFINLKTNSLDFITNTTVADGSPNTPFEFLTQDPSAFYWTSTFITDFKYNDTTQMAYVSSINKGVVGMSPVDKWHNVRLMVSIEIV